MGLLRMPGFLSVEECLDIRRGMDSGQAEVAEILGAGIHAKRSVRTATVVDPGHDLIGTVESMLESSRERVATASRTLLGKREGPGFLRYTSGGFYRAHRDRGEDPEWDGAARRAIALVIFLNTSRAVSSAGEFDGGLLRLFLPGGDIDVTPEAGLLVAFPADVLHEVTEVRDGTRDTVVDWFYDAIRS